MSAPQFHLHNGDCLDVLRTMEADSIDAIVTDPPYALTSQKKGGSGVASVNLESPYGRARIGTGNGAGGFMGMAWDSDLPGVEVWAECLRVLKPGGHLLAFGGTRTYHRLVVAIEDAGFEIRDMISWLYGQGFPKSMNVDKGLEHVRCHCDEGGNQVRGVRGVPRDAEGVVQEGEGPDVLAAMQRGAARAGVGAAWGEGFSGTEVGRQDVWSQQSSVEGRSDAPEAARQLREREVCALSGDPLTDGAEGRLCDGAPAHHGDLGREVPRADGSGASRGSRSAEQRPIEPDAMAVQPQSQAGGVWPVCGRCGKPVVPSGLGTALKPACEPICMARKPLAGTVAQNVQAHGTGALNIDGCRVPTDDDLNDGAYAENGGRGESVALRAGSGMNVPGKTVGKPFAQPPGRWPANVIHDGSDEVVAGFPAEAGGGARPARRGAGGVSTTGHGGQEFGERIPGDGFGSAARFFASFKHGEEEWLHQRRLDLTARFAASLFGSCETPTAEEVAAIRISGSKSGASPATPGSTTGSESSTPSRSHVQGAAQTGSTDTIQTTPSHLKSSGSAPLATAESTSLGQPARAEEDSGPVQGTRFRYCPKASKADRDAGLDHLDEEQFVQWQTGNGASGKPSSMSEGRDTRRRNIHPTVKPCDLMRYLCRLVTPPGGLILDPFMGSGSTGKAAILEGFRFVGIERQPEYMPLAEGRVMWAVTELGRIEAEAINERRRREAEGFQLPLFSEAAE